MNWRQHEAEIEYYYKLSDEEKKIIVSDGIKSEFWKLLRAYLCNTLRTTESQLVHMRVGSMDDLLKLSKFAESHKTVAEIFTLVEVLMAPKVSAVQPAVSRATRSVEKPKRVIKKELSNE
jgi:negative regulator of replication initiation